MKYYKFRNPFVMFSRDFPKNPHSGSHPHIVLGKLADGRYVSVSVTHSENVRGKRVSLLPSNIERTYFVSDKPYVRDPHLYLKPKQILNPYFVSDDDKKLLQDFLDKYPNGIYWK